MTGAERETPHGVRLHHLHPTLERRARGAVLAAVHLVAERAFGVTGVVAREGTCCGWLRSGRNVCGLRVLC